MIIGSDHSWYDWAVQNPDLSYSYCPINFATAYRNGVRFTFLKACSGSSDTRFYQLAIRDARAAGLLAAPYVWLYENNATQQADFWYLRLKNEPAIWIDFESYLTSVPKAHDLYEAIERLRSLGYKGIIGIYSSHDYWASYGNATAYWKQFPICFARYLSGGYPPPLTYPWTDHAPMNCDFWQWSALGSPAFYGVVNGKDAVDEQKFDGTPEQLTPLFGAAVPPEPPPGDNMEYEVIVGSLSIRPTAGTTQAAIGYLLLNDHVTGIDTAGWVKLATWTRAGVPVALPALNCYSATGNGAYLKVVTTPPPPAGSVNVKITANGAQIHNKDVPAGGAVSINIVD
jgi:hypothetical protein